MIVRKQGSDQSQKPNMGIGVILGKSFKLLSPCFFISSLKMWGTTGGRKKTEKDLGKAYMNSWQKPLDPLKTWPVGIQYLFVQSYSVNFY